MVQTSAPEFKMRTIMLCIVTEIMFRFVQWGLYSSSSDFNTPSTGIVSYLTGVVTIIIGGVPGAPWFISFPFVVVNLICVSYLGIVIYYEFKDYLPSIL